MKNKDLISVPDERIVSRILLIHGEKVMLDSDLAELYGVETKALNQAVSRNSERFPEDFMFQLTKEETNIWKSQIVISNREKMGLRKSPLVFTEQGVAMLSSVLKSKRAIQVNVAIVRAFVRLRQMLSTNKELRRKIEGMEKKYDKRFKVIFDVIKQLLAKEEEPEPGRQLGFRTGDRR